MKKTYNIYCDESCHLRNSFTDTMVLGAIWVPKRLVKKINQEIRKIKAANGFKSRFEMKWTKVSPGKISFYLDILEYFFNHPDLHFRAIIINNKSKLSFDNDEDYNTWYYKMFFVMLHFILDPQIKYKIFLDIKDTLGGQKVRKLKDVLCNSMYDFNNDIIQDIQLVRSHEIEILQLTDLLIGAIGYLNRGLDSSEAKLKFIRTFVKKSKYSLTRSTLAREQKINLLRWEPNEQYGSRGNS
ncbi:MAG: DUF3800 domain-containing protein [bacterium]|nr:DUF3800 domain-containing protein [bacterium]